MDIVADMAYRDQREADDHRSGHISITRKGFEVLARGEVRCERCQSIYPLRDKHECKASEPSS